MALCVSVELVWWLICWILGKAPAPLLGIYALLAAAGLLSALALRAALRWQGLRASSPAVVAGALLSALGASLFLPLKFAIPREIPFWLDQPLALAERRLFGSEPWLLLDHVLGWAAIPIDVIYAVWLPVQSLLLFVVILEPPSRKKSHALIAYSLTWFLLGVVAALILSSAGPLFYDRLFGGNRFFALHETLVDRHAWVALSESDGMWASLATGRPGLVAGISAVPSIHVAISLWMYLAARQLMPRAAPAALAYAALIWVGSVQLGWHYASDGLVGALGMAAIWGLSGKIETTLTRRFQPSRRP